METQAAARELHQPVLLERCLDLLSPALEEGGVFVDGTLGMGGHTEGVLERFPRVQVIGIDRDPQALALASERLESFGERFSAHRGTYDQIFEICASRGVKPRGILLDLGVSSLQLDESERGFSYAQDAPLDMRMDQENGLSAAQFLANASAAEITRVLKIYGEEKFAPKIAAKIVARREEAPLKRTGELVELIRAALPQAAMRKGGNPAKKTFQAIRIHVNGELDILHRTLPRAFAALEEGGRLLVESYHSLEDRIVKRFFTDLVRDQVPAGVPVTAAQVYTAAKSLTRGAEKADEKELVANPRSASVRLRAIEKLSPHNQSNPFHQEPAR